MLSSTNSFFFFFFNDTATTEIYTLSLHDALPISTRNTHLRNRETWPSRWLLRRSEEHTSELQSRQYLVCRLLLEKKKIHVRSVTLSTPMSDHLVVLCSTVLL